MYCGSDALSRLRMYFGAAPSTPTFVSAKYPGNDLGKSHLKPRLPTLRNLLGEVEEIIGWSVMAMRRHRTAPRSRKSRCKRCHIVSVRPLYTRHEATTVLSYHRATSSGGVDESTRSTVCRYWNRVLEDRRSRSHLHLRQGAKGSYEMGGPNHRAAQTFFPIANFSLVRRAFRECVGILAQEVERGGFFR